MQKWMPYITKCGQSRIVELDLKEEKSFMGEIADMRLNGTACECCEVFFEDIIEGGTPPGYPRICEDCEEETK